MKLHLFVRRQAETDISKGYLWYEKQVKGLGYEFINSIDILFRSIQSHPSRFPKVHKNIQRALLRRFPYGIFFIRELESIVVLAVLHQARDPRHWKIKYSPRQRRSE